VRGACGKRVRERGGMRKLRKPVRCLFVFQCQFLLCDAELGSAKKDMRAARGHKTTQRRSVSSVRRVRWWAKPTVAANG